jgi:hypothetical protein
MEGEAAAEGGGVTFLESVSFNADGELLEREPSKGKRGRA